MDEDITTAIIWDDKAKAFSPHPTVDTSTQGVARGAILRPGPVAARCVTEGGIWLGGIWLTLLVDIPGTIGPGKGLDTGIGRPVTSEPSSIVDKEAGVGAVG